MDIANLNLSVRAYNILGRNGLLTTEAIHEHGIENLKKIRGMGNRTYNEIIEKLEEANEYKR